MLLIGRAVLMLDTQEQKEREKNNENAPFVTGTGSGPVRLTRFSFLGRPWRYRTRAPVHGSRTFSWVESNTSLLAS